MRPTACGGNLQAVGRFDVGDSMNKTLAIVVVVAAVVLVGVAGLMVLNRGGTADSTSTPPAIAPGDMREHNRKQIGEMLDADRARGEEARRMSTGTTREASQPQPATQPAGSTGRSGSQ
jgi:uncharacterized membrane protein